MSAEGSGPLRVCEGCEAEEILSKISDSRKACLQNIPCLTAEEQHICEQGKEQIHAGLCKKGDPLHAVEQGICVEDAGDA